MQGKIVKAIAGFYYVNVAESGIYECRARGIFRKKNLKPLVGDLAELEVISEEEREGHIKENQKKKNELIRPAIANVDLAVILFAMRDPDPNLVLLDRFLIESAKQGVGCAIVFNKTDMADEDELRSVAEIYSGCGAQLLFMSVRRSEGLDAFRDLVRGRTVVLAGPSGVGKSSLINSLQDEVRMEVGDISRKLSRGKNTTRHTQLICAGPYTYICDTPGFTALDTAGVTKEELERYYAEFTPYTGKCYFQGCAHRAEPGCAVKEALDSGAFSRIRYEHYAYIYDELKEAERRRYQ